MSIVANNNDKTTKGEEWDMVPNEITEHIRATRTQIKKSKRLKLELRNLLSLRKLFTLFILLMAYSKFVRYLILPFPSLSQYDIGVFRS